MTRRSPRAIAALCAVAGASLLAASGVAAKQVTTYTLAGSFDGTGSTTGAFNEVDSIAVNQQSGRVYVIDDIDDSVSQFDANGNPVPFTAPGLGGASSIKGFDWQGPNFGSAGPDIAVDNSGGPTQGNIYVFEGGTSGLLWGYDSTGAVLPGNWPRCGAFCGAFDLWGTGTGIAVDPDGLIWLGDRSGNGVGDPPIAGNRLVAIDSEALLANEPPVLFTNVLGGAPYRLDFASNGDAVLSTEQSFGWGPVAVNRVTPEGEITGPQLGVGPGHAIAVDRRDDTILVDQGNRIDVLTPGGELVNTFANGTQVSFGLAVNETTGRIYVGNQATTPNTVDMYMPDGTVTVPDLTIEEAQPSATGSTATLRGTVDPDNGGDTTDCHFEWGIGTLNFTNSAPCAEGHVHPSAGGPQEVSAAIGGLTKGATYYYRLFSSNGEGIEQGSRVRSFIAADPPIVTGVSAIEVNTDTARVKANVDPEGSVTTYRVEYGPSPALGEFGPPLQTKHHNNPENVTITLEGLIPGETYYFRIVAENITGTDESEIGTFTTFDFTPVIEDDCPNALARQQTGASLLLDCRAYELVSAPEAGYNVTSDLAPDQSPFPGFPRASDSVLYSVHDGGIAGTGNPTNRGPDPYLARRGAEGWATTYVGIPSNVNAETGPFSSTLAAADASLSTFAFGGPELCDPCFAEDDSTGIPLRLPDGTLVQGMRGSIPVAQPEPAGQVNKPLSENGRYLLFGSEQRFEPDGNNNGDVTIYKRDLVAGTTRVVSKTPGGTTMTGDGIAALDISADGSRTLIGRLVSTDAKGNQRWHLYMHIGDSSATVPVTEAAGGVLYNGMTADGSQVIVTATATMGDTDTSADVFRLQVSPGGTTVGTVSSASNSDACDPVGNAENPADWNVVAGGPTDCSAVGLAGGAGVARDSGTVFFLSPEDLDGSGEPDQPNLYRVEGSGAPELVATLEPNNPLVRNAVSDNEVLRTADFQVNASGADAAFASTRSLTGFNNAGFAQVYRHNPDDGGIVCVSCTPTQLPSTSSSSLASNGLSVTDDGRVFFNSSEPLALRDANKKGDVYEWTPEDGGDVELISSGIDAHDSSLLTVTADGRDAYFFTREKLSQHDRNGPLVKIYTAREGGGFFVVPPFPDCAASDECHGPGTQAAPPASIRTVAESDGQVPAALRDCGGLARRARALGKRAKTLARQAQRAEAPRRKRRLSRKAAKVRKAAGKARGAAKRCREEGRGRR